MYYGDSLPKVSLRLLTQHTCHNPPILSIIKVREAVSYSRNYMKTVVKVGITPKNHTHPDNETTYLVIFNSPMGIKPENHESLFQLVQIVPFTKNSRGRPLSMSLIDATSEGVKTSIKLEAYDGINTSKYALLVDKLSQVYLEPTAQNKPSTSPNMSIVNIRRAPRLGASAVVEITPENATCPKDISMYRIRVSSTRAAAAYENFDELPLASIYTLSKHDTNLSPSLSLIGIIREGLKTFIKLEVTSNGIKNQCTVMFEEPPLPLPEISASA
ncbi:hypothetical protein [Candidatus Ichthyocystis hellenicum]|uniref:hypothetical protein n=1 Tax=Candidatus Ichthyocystis hellenicum TaxID=1561003 RepID=UPI001F5F3C5F|nr:hypothetical protein [Candidatus Ichthyocystis hellenicum]